MSKKWRDEQRKNKESRYYLWELKTNNERNKEKNKKRNNYFFQELLRRKEFCGYYTPKRWSKKEVEYLHLNYNKSSLSVMAKKLQRSYCSIARKLNRLKLRKNHNWENLKITNLTPL